MPFEISPKYVEAPAKVGRFQKYADALLDGCARTKPARLAIYYESYWPWISPKACALGAMALGLGRDPYDLMGGGMLEVRAAYTAKYGTYIESDNDRGERTREEIAARVAAL